MALLALRKEVCRLQKHCSSRIITVLNFRSVVTSYKDNAGERGFHKNLVLEGDSRQAGGGPRGRKLPFLKLAPDLQQFRFLVQLWSPFTFPSNLATVSLADAREQDITVTAASLSLS